MARARDSELLDRRQVFSGRIVDLSVDRVRLANSRVSELEVVRHPGAVAVVAMTRDNKVLLVRQYRYATGEWILEVPAGKLEEGERPEICARRELEEETGFVAGSWRDLGWVWTSPGFTNEKIWLFLANDLEPGEQDLQPDEVLSVESIEFDEALEKAQLGEIYDAKTIVALFRASLVMVSDP